MSEQRQSLQEGVMNAIRKGEVRMKPRWHFLLLSLLSVTGVFIVLLALLYIASLALFFLRDSGVWFTPSFGVRGWLSLVHTLPWPLLLLVLLFAIVLELLVRRYAFVYKKPLLTSLVGIVVLIVLGGFAIARTPLHRELMHSALRGQLPAPMGILYAAPVRMPPPPDVYRGQILAILRNGLVIADEGSAGTTTVLITPGTRLPYGQEFVVGERVVVVGDVASGTVRAFGIREIDEYNTLPVK
jgi:hypothetical protein